MIKTQEAAVALLSLCGFLQQSTVAAHMITVNTHANSQQWRHMCNQQLTVNSQQLTHMLTVNSKQ